MHTAHFNETSLDQKLNIVLADILGPAANPDYKPDDVDLPTASSSTTSILASPEVVNSAFLKKTIHSRTDESFNNSVFRTSKVQNPQQRR